MFGEHLHTHIGRGILPMGTSRTTTPLRPQETRLGSRRDDCVEVHASQRKTYTFDTCKGPSHASLRFPASGDYRVLFRRLLYPALASFIRANSGYNARYVCMTIINGLGFFVDVPTEITVSTYLLHRRRRLYRPADWI